MSGDDIDYTDVSYIPDEGLLFVDTCALSFTGLFGTEDSEEIKVERAKNCLNRFRSRCGGIVASKGILEEIDVTIIHYKGKKIKTRRAIARSRMTKRASHPRSKIRSTPRYFNRIFKGDNDPLRIYRSLYELLERETKSNSFEVPEKISSGIWSYISHRDDLQKLSFADKELLVDLISSGSGRGLFSSDLPMIGAYRQAVKNLSLENCFVCDGFHSETYRLGSR
jgi:hypothetical protein